MINGDDEEILNMTKKYNKYFTEILYKIEILTATQSSILSSMATITIVMKTTQQLPMPQKYAA